MTLARNLREKEVQIAEKRRKAAQEKKFDAFHHKRMEAQRKQEEEVRRYCVGCCLRLSVSMCAACVLSGCASVDDDSEVCTPKCDHSVTQGTVVQPQVTGCSLPLLLLTTVTRATIRP